MSYQHGWKGGWQNNLLSHSSPPRAQMFVPVLGSTVMMLRLLLLLRARFFFKGTD